MRPVLLLAAAVSVSLQPFPAEAQRKEISVTLVTQQTPSWCWAATSSMALTLLGFPDINPGRNYQCGVVAAAFSECEEDCTQCVTSLDSMDKLVGVLDRYRDLSIGIDKTSSIAGFSPNYAAYPRLSRIERSIHLSYPVIVGISPDGLPADPAAAQHTVLITGYDDNHRGTGEAWITVADPYPYEAGADPYGKAGFRYHRASGKAELPWRVLRDRLNLTSAVFLEKRSA